MMDTSTNKDASISTRFKAGGIMEVFVIAYPTVLTMFSHSIISAADTLMTGHLGVSELAAVGFTSILLMTTFALFIDGIDIVNTFSSQAFGEGRPAEAGRRGWHGIYLALLSWPFMLLCVPFIGDVLHLLGPNAEVAELGRSYGEIRLYGAGLIFIHVALASFFRGVGMVKTPMIISVAMNLLNILLDYLLIFGKFGLPAMGVDGAAWASNISVLAGDLALFMVFVWPAINRRFSIWKQYSPSIILLGRMVRVGLPAGIHFFVDTLSFTIFSAIIASIGEMELAASQIGFVVINVVFTSAWGVSIATSTLVGQYIGAGRLETAERSAMSAGRLVFYAIVGVFLVISISPTAFVSFFTDDLEVVYLGATLLYLVVLFGLFNGPGMIAVGALRGAGDTRWIMVVSLVLAWLFYLPSAYYLVVVKGMGLIAAWSTATAYIILVSAAFISRFLSGKWKTMKI